MAFDSSGPSHKARPPPSFENTLAQKGPSKQHSRFFATATEEDAGDVRKFSRKYSHRQLARVTASLGDKRTVCPAAVIKGTRLEGGRHRWADQPGM
ncbi:hypothetical protein SKAU_G00112450 [Synaphobranchus kaupii]|uniref:Uncharacterized protein n=1 Tax=Synaphobranchus kaupii TaxID=118154 RepID=A0A9Q1G0Z7_SYNKA|nr:hypothetical protein SKAU_G00112450 [Synaphobranchus kaupii]